MRTRITLELEVDIDFRYAPGSPSSYDDPGQPDAVCIDAVTVEGHRLPLSVFSRYDLEAMEEAAFKQVDGFCPVLDRD